MGKVVIENVNLGSNVVENVMVKNVVLEADTGTYAEGEIVSVGDTNIGGKYTDGTHLVGDKLLIITGEAVDTTGAAKTVVAMSIGKYRKSAVTPTLTDATIARLSFSGIELL